MQVDDLMVGTFTWIHSVYKQLRDPSKNKDEQNKALNSIWGKFMVR